MKKTDKPSIMYFVIKKIFDIFIGLIGLVFLIPLTLIVFLLNAFSGDFGPVFYKQKRIGKNGKHFWIYKYRSMVKNADKKLQEYLESNPEAKKEYEENWKLENDPRITKIGKFLRKSSLDEMPQVINLLNGTMSVVGPRPVVDKEIDKYGKNKERFLSVLPGLTGYWQVNGRSSTNYESRIKLDMYYVDNRSLWLDFKIFARTFGAVFEKRGAK